MPFVALLILLAQAAAVPAPAAYVPERVYDTRRAAFADFEIMLAELAAADVVFVGEQHDDPNTHRLEHALLDGMRRRRRSVTLSLEMFERDVQGTLDRYLAGAIGEAEFLETARPWPRYATDYRPLVELARSSGWPVLAANVPRRYAADVARTGRTALDRLSDADRTMAARDLECPRDAYFERFAAAMGGHTTATARTSDAKPEVKPAETAGGRPADGNPVSPSASDSAAKPPGKPPDPASTERYYWSQCLKDETMAESIATAFAARKAESGPIVHVNGAFHSDFGTGAAERTRRRLAHRRIAVVTILPVTDIDTVKPAGDDLKRADFLIYTVK